MTHHQSALSTLISEDLSDPTLAGDAVFRRLLEAGLQDLVDAEAAEKIGPCHTALADRGVRAGVP